MTNTEKFIFAMIKQAGQINPDTASNAAFWFGPTGAGAYAGAKGEHGHPGLRTFGRSSLEGAAGGIGGMGAGGAAGAGLGAALSLLSRGKVKPGAGAAAGGVIGGATGLFGGSTLGTMHGARAAAQNYNEREHPALTKIIQLLHKLHP